MSVHMGGDDLGESASAQDASALDMGPLRDDVGFQIHITRRAIWNALRAARRQPPKRMPSGFFSSVLLIGTNPGVSPSQLAEALAMDQPNMAQIMRLLEEAKLVARNPHPADRRRIALTLTPAGWEQFAKVSEVNQAHNRKIGGGMTDAERRQLIDLLAKVRASVSSAE
jgi:DNA-binding MarR family transcriptional regulator